MTDESFLLMTDKEIFCHLYTSFQAFRSLHDLQFSPQNEQF